MMRRFCIALLALLIVSPALTQQVTQGVPGVGQLPGTATNDSANSGNVGQIISASTAETNQGATGATITVTITSPAIITWGTTNPYSFSGSGCAAINFTTTGALPTGIVAGTNYYVIGSSVSGNTFQIATSCDNAIAGTAIDATGTQSGVHTGLPRAILSNGGTTNISGISLPAGDWDVSGDAVFTTAANTSITLLAASTTTASGTYQNNSGQAAQYTVPAQVPGAGNNIFHIGPKRFSLAVTTTLYIVHLPLFTVNTLDGWGGIRARRTR